MKPWSGLLPVLSGVHLKAASLGLLLFLNDLPVATKHSLILLFADNTKCLKRISSKQDSKLLQSIYNWDWNLAFNESKVIHLRFFNQARQATTYFIATNEVATKDTHRDLGILVSADWAGLNIMTSFAAKHTRSWVSWKEAWPQFQPVPEMFLYNSLVCSQLTYSSQVWRPQQIKDIIKLELVQQRATKFIFPISRYIQGEINSTKHATLDNVLWIIIDIT